MTLSSSERDFTLAADATRIRELLLQARLSHAEAARVLEINEVRLRSYCAGAALAPRYVLLALERLVELEKQTWHQ